MPRTQVETQATARGASKRTQGEPAESVTLRPPQDANPRELSRAIHAELASLGRGIADSVARHLVAAGRLLDSQPDRALAHALAARRLASRVAAVREATGLAAYQAGEWSTAIAELRAYHRMSGVQTHLAILADCERALGRPERAIDIYRTADRAKLDRAAAIELLIVAAGARSDLGQREAALSMLRVPELNAQTTEPWLARLRYAYADALLAAGRHGEAREWFARAVDADVDASTDAAERLLELDGVILDERETDEETLDEERYEAKPDEQPGEHVAVPGDEPVERQVHARPDGYDVTADADHDAAAESDDDLSAGSSDEVSDVTGDQLPASDEGRGGVGVGQSAPPGGLVASQIEDVASRVEEDEFIASEAEDDESTPLEAAIAAAGDELPAGDMTAGDQKAGGVGARPLPPASGGPASGEPAAGEASGRPTAPDAESDEFTARDVEGDEFAEQPEPPSPNEDQNEEIDIYQEDKEADATVDGQTISDVEDLDDIERDELEYPTGAAEDRTEPK